MSTIIAIAALLITLTAIPDTPPKCSQDPPGTFVQADALVHCAGQWRLTTSMSVSEPAE